MVSILPPFEIFSPYVSSHSRNKIFICVYRYTILCKAFLLGNKIRTNIYLDEAVLREAQELGLNISKTSENALKLAIEHLKPIYSKSTPQITTNLSSKDNKASGGV